MSELIIAFINILIAITIFIILLVYFDVVKIVPTKKKKLCRCIVAADIGLDAPVAITFGMLDYNKTISEFVNSLKEMPSGSKFKGLYIQCKNGYDEILIENLDKNSVTIENLGVTKKSVVMILLDVPELISKEIKANIRELSKQKKQKFGM